MADTGRTVWADGLWADDFWAAGLWATDEAVTVPDVVGETQAAGTATLEGDGFVVAVETAYSSVVAAGLIISQSPIGGSSAAPGSTVTITVSLGDAPVADAQPSGGWPGFDHEWWRWQRRKKELEEAEEEVEEIADEIDRNIGLLLQEQERKDEERKALARLSKLVSALPIETDQTERVQRALELAKQKQSLASYERLEREFKRMNEEDEFAFLLMMIADL